MPPAGNAEHWLSFTGGGEVAEYRALRAELAGSPELAAIDNRLSRQLFELARMTNRYAST